ncbi:conjugal transfer protein [Pelomonas sp. HMWF004]|nr:conjugal transfer protein [Pelomonas sp. HMWF004]
MKKNPPAICLGLTLIGALVATPARAEDLGTSGQGHSLDRDAREQLKDVARRKQQNGELDAYWKTYREKMEEAIRHPAPLGIATSYARLATVRELKFTLPSDYRNERGQVVAKAGTVIEPLKIQPLRSGLIFIDGRDPRQVNYAIEQGRKQPLKIVLTAGSPLDLRIKYKDSPWLNSIGIPFYFDQRKMISNNLKMLYGIDLKTVPVMMKQQGDKLAIEYGMPS